MDIQMFGKISDAFGPSGFEEDVIRTIAGYCKEFELSNDAMNNLYARMPGASAELPVVQLDAHTEDFILQAFRLILYGSGQEPEKWFVESSAQNRFIL